MKKPWDYVRFNDDAKSTSSFSVNEPVHEVARHLGGGAVELEKALEVALGPGGAELDGMSDALICFLLPGQGCQRLREVQHLLVRVGYVKYNNDNFVAC